MKATWTEDPPKLFSVYLSTIWLQLTIIHVIGCDFKRVYCPNYDYHNDNDDDKNIDGIITGGEEGGGGLNREGDLLTFFPLKERAY